MERATQNLAHCEILGRAFEKQTARVAGSEVEHPWWGPQRWKRKKRKQDQTGQGRAKWVREGWADMDIPGRGPGGRSCVRVQKGCIGLCAWAGKAQL